MWLSVGKANLADVASKMTPEQIGLAQKMARRCDESNYKQCGDELSVSATSVLMQLEGGTYVVPVVINEAITFAEHPSVGDRGSGGQDVVVATLSYRSTAFVAAWLSRSGATSIEEHATRSRDEA